MTHRYADPRHWDGRYSDGDAPWNSGLVSRELVLRLDELGVESGAAIELGCGSGVNAAYLAERGFRCTGVDLSPAAIQAARARCEASPESPTFLERSVADLGFEAEFDLLFDRGCYHCVRQYDVAGYVRAVARAARPGAPFVLLTGSDRDPQSPGPPTVRRDEAAAELGADFDLVDVRPFHFQDAGGVDGPLGWSFLLRRKSTA